MYILRGLSENRMICVPLVVASFKRDCIGGFD